MNSEFTFLQSMLRRDQCDLKDIIEKLKTKLSTVTVKAPSTTQHYNEFGTHNVPFNDIVGPNESKR
jgi:hypothetical protein